jgi:hypothetical protein
MINRSDGTIKEPLPQLVMLFARIYNPLPQFHGDGTPHSPASGTIVKYEVTYSAGGWNSLHNACRHSLCHTPPPTQYIPADFERPGYEAGHPTASGRVAATPVLTKGFLIMLGDNFAPLPSYSSYSSFFNGVTARVGTWLLQ